MADPAGHQRQRYGGAAVDGPALQGLLEIEQAKIIFPALAQYGGACLFRRIGEQARQFAVDLALQVAGVGGDPDTAAAAFAPQGGGDQIAHGLADAGAGLCQNGVGLTADIPWGEGGGDGGGIIALRRAGFRCRAKAFGKPAANLVGVEDNRVGRRRRGAVLPFRQVAPDVEPVAGA